MNTLEILYRIGKENEDIESFSFHSFPKQHLLQDNQISWSKTDKQFFNAALSLRNQSGLPFWDSVMLSCFNNPDYSKIILHNAMRHNSIKEDVYVEKNNLLSTNLNSLCDGERLACCSRVQMKDKSIRHLPMLDFHIPVSDMNFKVVQEVCLTIGLHNGYLLNSGESYHYLANFTVEWDELFLLLAKSILFCPIIDRAWISHQLQEKCCSLRVDKKNGKEVQFIAEI